MALKYIIFVICIGMTWAQTEPSLSDAINNLPPELQGKVDEKQVTELKNKSMQVFKKKCEENGGTEAYPQSEKSFLNFVECLKELVDPAKLQEEIEAAKPTGQVDEVFKKYCEKTPSFKSCFRNMTESVKPCFSVEEQKNLKTVYNISEQLAEFVCFKEGDRIALFIAENGPECFNEKKAELEMCANHTLGSEFHYDQNKFPIDNIPEIKFGEDECDKFAELQICVVSALETCSTPTSANIVESLFKFVRKSTPCKELPEKADGNSSKRNGDTTLNNKSNSANSLTFKSITMGMIVLALLV
ncbi:27 kDa hemolymph protein-like isoform X1 [Vanessa atalanta]|uniref:27 kDa hemolymph protein-like isoform X1 n=1 Tax=Vanessa atalanta TaxID=42275 RepID=UPI001FCD5603|nr:27 kDa hemolymph protein-like isoform X1 [Vanessa atalanta]